MNYLRIKETDDPLLTAVLPLYELSFPEKERRNISQLCNLLTEEKMQFNVLTDNSSAIGFFILWEFEKFIYIEHIAIDPVHRGRNYGSAIIRQITDSSQKTLLLEVEPGDDDISKKRILFYGRLGLKLCPFNYKQPPYRKHEESFPMLIMSYPHELSKESFEEYTAIIKAEVYDKWL